MQSEEYLIAALRALAEQDREREAPEEVEMRLLAAFRRNRSRRKWKTVVLASLAAAAGLTVFFFARTDERPKPVARSPVPQQVVEATPPVEIAAPPARKAVRPVTRQPREIVTEFFPLLDVAPPFERGQLLRVVVPAATMREVGLPVNEDRLADRVYADVLVGDEGLARAIRFVSYEE
ncbi:MAG: hypothetical protein JWO19_1881 [Bryobacterales bacterium]|jgi:hypothetical protein|nr:hypothetical protein [Bryobacterales bacterium]